MTFSRRTIGWLALLLLPMACDPSSPGDATSPGDRGVSLAPINYDDWTHLLQDFRGSIVVVDFWATWCSPCLERFPRLVELHNRYSGQGVQFFSMCLDDRSESEAIQTARQFLTEQHATFPNYFMDENILDAFEKLDLLGIPAVFVYDRIGVLQYRLTGDDPRNQFSDEDVEQAIETLLKSRHTE